MVLYTRIGWALLEHAGNTVEALTAWMVKPNAETLAGVKSKFYISLPILGAIESWRSLSCS